MARKRTKVARAQPASARPPTLRRDRRFYQNHLPYVNAACNGVSTVHRHLFGMNSRPSVPHAANLQSAMKSWTLEKLCRVSHARSRDLWRQHIPTFAALEKEIGDRIGIIVALPPVTK